MALSKTLLFIALALAIASTISAQGRNRGGGGRQESEESESREGPRGGRGPQQGRSEESESSEESRGFFGGLFGGRDDSGSDESEDSSPESRRSSGILRQMFDRFGGRDSSSSAEGDRRRGDRLMEPCKFENVAAPPVEPTPTEPSEDGCGDFARCDVDNAVELADADGTVLYKVSFCRVNYNTLMAHLGNNTCEGPACFGPFSIPGGATDLHFCGTENEALTIENIRRCRNQRPRGDGDEMESSEEMSGDGGPAGPEEMGPGEGPEEMGPSDETETSTTTTMRPAPAP